MATPANAITLVVEGRAEDNGDVRLEDFTDKLTKLRLLLTEADRLLNGRQTVYYRVADLRHQSPATVVLEPVPLSDVPDLGRDYGAVVAQAVLLGARTLGGAGEVPDFYGFDVLDAYRAVSTSEGSRVSAIRLVTQEGEAELGQILTDRVNEIVGRVEREIGSITGFIERLNIHADTRTFYIYPNHGAKRVKCSFPKHLREDLIRAVGRYATVYGTLVYQGRQRFAEEMVSVTEIEIHPKVEDLPDILSLRGIVEPMDEGAPLAW